MKKFFLILLSVVMCLCTLGLFACGDAEEPSGDGEQENPPIVNPGQGDDGSTDDGNGDGNDAGTNEDAGGTGETDVPSDSDTDTPSDSNDGGEEPDDQTGSSSQTPSSPTPDDGKVDDNDLPNNPSTPDTGDNNQGDSTVVQSFTITFKQEGFDDVVMTVQAGQTLTDIPTPKEVLGYDVVWSETEFTSVEENLVVNAIKTPKTYTITYELVKLSNNMPTPTISSKTTQVKYNQQFTLLKPSCDDYTFVKWVIKGTNQEFTDGVYSLTEDITLCPIWERDSTDNF